MDTRSFNGGRTLGDLRRMVNEMADLPDDTLVVMHADFTVNGEDDSITGRVRRANFRPSSRTSEPARITLYN